MAIDPNDHLQTHDPMGRTFTQPEPGGPVAGKLNLTVGSAKASGQIIISLQDDGSSVELFLTDDEAEDGVLDMDSDEILPLLEPLTSQMEEYGSVQAYYDWYETFVGDLTVAEGRKQVVEILEGAGLTWESTG